MPVFATTRTTPISGSADAHRDQEGKNKATNGEKR